MTWRAVNSPAKNYINNVFESNQGIIVNKSIILLLASFFIFVSDVQAVTKYVGDHLIITLRSGQGSQHKIIKTITTGTKLDIIEEFPDTGYAKAVLEDGTEGWVRLQYLSDKPVAKDRLEWLQKRYEKLKQKHEATKQELKSLKGEFSKLSRENSQVNKDYKALQDRTARINEVAAKPILLDKENRELKEKNVTLSNEMQLISQENQILKDRSDRDWFIAGGGVIVVGILLGLLLPKLRSGKKSSWSGGSL